MASLDHIRDLYAPPQPDPPALSLAPNSSTASVLSPRADFYPPYGSGSGQPYAAASNGRRLGGWQPARLGPTTSLWSTRDLMLARSRDEIRNNPLAASAADNFESQHVGNGFRPRWNLTNERLKLQIETQFNRWAKSTSIDLAGRLNFYGLQALAAREIFASGEVLVRRYLRPPSWRMKVPLQLQLLQAEQMPIWLNTVAGVGYGPTGTPEGNAVRTGIEFDPLGRRTAYHLYRENPGETMFYPLEGLQFMRVPASNMLHVFKPWQAGLMRGQPHLSSVLVLLHEIGKYMDASVVKKQIQTMFAAFIEKASPDGDVLPPSLLQPNGQAVPYGGSPWPQPYGTVVSDIETGTIQNLFPGEKIIFPQLPAESDMKQFMDIALHHFAVAIGMTYEQVTGDLKGVNLSSIRAGILDFRRKCEQFVNNILIAQFGIPVVSWFLEEAVLSGALKLPNYARDPEAYLDIDWFLSGWPWIDPEKDVQAHEAEVRGGFDSREAVCAAKGLDVTTVDAAQVRDNARADRMGLVHETDPRRILIGRQSDATVAPPVETPEGLAEVGKAEEKGSQDDAGSND